jgi:glutathionyl-hydroquinone reductase
MLINGQWSTDRFRVQTTDESGRFVRQVAGFRCWVTPDGAPGPSGEGGFAAEPGRYRLIVALTCPWASRTLIARKLKGLEQVIALSIVEPAMTDQGWRFGDETDRGALDATFVHEVYTRARPDYTGRATVPVLWDEARRTIVNNESADLLRMLNSGFGALASSTIDLYPPELRAAIDALNDQIYQRLNNGVYRAGFAVTQQAYEDAVTEVFAMLDELEARLADGRTFLFGERLTESDIRLFVTLVLRCRLSRPVQMQSAPAGRLPRQLSAYLARMLAVPGVRETVSIDHIKRGYYAIKPLNPNGIVPLGPLLPGLD